MASSSSAPALLRRLPAPRRQQVKGEPVVAAAAAAASAAAAAEYLAAAVRGLECSAETAEVLQGYLGRLSSRVSKEVEPLLKRWVQRALDCCDLAAACRMHAHLLLLLKDSLWEELSPQSVTAIVSSLFFLFAHHSFAGESAGSALSLQLLQQQQGLARSSSSSSNAATPGTRSGTGGDSAAAASAGDTAAAAAAAGETLGISDAEIYQLLQEQRLLLIRWLDLHPEAAGAVLETAIQSVTFSGTGMSTARAAAAAAAATATAAAAAEETDAAAAALAACAAASNVFAPDRGLAMPVGCSSTGRGAAAATPAAAAAAAATAGAGPSGCRRWRAVEGLGVSGRYIPAAAATGDSNSREAGEEAAAAGAAAAAAKRAQAQDQQQQEQQEQRASGGVGLLRGAVVAMHAAMKRSTLRLLGGETPQLPAAAGQAAAYAEALKASLAMESEVQANLQTAELSLRQNHMQLLGFWANSFGDFLQLFGATSRSAPIQTAVVEETPQRLWLRLLGLDHDLVRWAPCPSFFTTSDALKSAFPREYRVRSSSCSSCSSSSSGSCSSCSSCFEAEEAWVAPYASAFFSRHFVGSQVYVQRAPRLKGLQAAHQLFEDWTRGVSRRAAAAASAAAAAAKPGKAAARRAAAAAAEEASGAGTPVTDGDADSVYSDTDFSSNSSSSSINSSGSLMRFLVWVHDAASLDTEDPRELLPVEAAGPADFRTLAEAFEAQAARRPDEGPTVACTPLAAAAAAVAAAAAAAAAALRAVVACVELVQPHGVCLCPQLRF
ncbi:hypothetical protein ETH_00035690 [Eimeria tenella]|uniref:EF hand domain-containing protein n=1 Tax=Eimeria tenella TaxID=5802 RepID=U6LAH7_EIMTE|nr:hypothetical protein ETH_00035690 [Eimeria tenella]CDJ44780.1 hypothetical protein ETH_00035690 [Eimeria tenella]|eukprot:XP_013235528.1 hypothetical protein ETH_00035690 [Eimeria tenella]